MEKFVGGKMFDNVVVDDRVTKDLSHCLYCTVTSQAQNGGVYSLDYKIPLDCINGAHFKQCPACKRIYIVGNILI